MSQYATALFVVFIVLTAAYFLAHFAAALVAGALPL